MLLVGALAAGALLAEIAVRLAGYRPDPLENSLFVPLEDELARFGLKPGWNDLFCGKRVTVDSNGRRAVRPAAGGSRARHGGRVLLVGDSVVFGYCVSDEETIASQLQSLLDRRGTDLTVENIGVPAYSTWNEVGALRRYLETSAADHVVVLWVSNDPTDDLDPLRISGDGRQAAGSGFLFRLRRWSYRHWYTSHLVTNSLKRFSRSEEEPGPAAAPAAQLARSVDGLAEMRRLSIQHGATFSVGVYFGPWMVNDSNQPSKWARRVLAKFRESGTEPFEVLSHLRRLPRSELHVSLNDRHPSARAIGLIAEDIAEELERVRSR